MRLIEYLTEATGQYGIIISRERSSGKFEDMELYDIGSGKIITHGNGHVQDLFQHFLSVANEVDGWNVVEKFVKQEAPAAKEMGEEYSDDPDFSNTLYGPLSLQQIGQLSTDMEEQFGNKGDEGDWDTDEFKRAEFDSTEARAINRGR